jgi:carbonic anhydrase/acetyltransferase-like protein (isoleucine patch superfamily)
MTLPTPTIDPSAFIGPHVTLWGDVRIGPSVVLLPGVVMRAEFEHIEVGEESNVQDNVVFHVDEGYPLTLGRRVTIGHSAMLHGCTVGDGALIGISATVLNGAIVGERAMVAAGSLVPPGMEVPAGMLALGSPAKVRRPLTDEELAHNDRGVDTYLGFARRYRDAGLP